MRIGFIVNPIAGMGGRVGLKGTDGVVGRAVSRGALPVAPSRAVEFFSELRQRSHDGFEFLCCPGNMGAQEAEAAEICFRILPMIVGKETSAKDTQFAVKLLIESGVDLIAFVGGDGTARDILNAMKQNTNTPVLGIPAGVKMYSSVFAVNPTDAANALVALAENRAEIVDSEVVDSDENAIRKDVFAVKLYGYLKGLAVRALIQVSKEVSPETADEKEQQTEIARYVVDEMTEDGTFILGPGTTVERVAECLGVKKTVLGVDVYKEGKIISDVDERTLLRKIGDGRRTWLILSPIGHQGILLGRGNQQISPEVVRRVGRNHILVLATIGKLRSVEGRALRVDTGDAEVDILLRGSIRVVTGYREGVTVLIQ